MEKKIIDNRKNYLEELRSGKYKKGTILSDEKGKPVIPEGTDFEGSCACAIMHDLFFDYEGTKSNRNYLKALAITPIECRFIQKNLNDTNLTFEEIANEIESKIFANQSNES